MVDHRWRECQGGQAAGGSAHRRSSELRACRWLSAFSSTGAPQLSLTTPSGLPPARARRYNRREKQRAELFLRLIREYARGRTFTARLAFSDVCRHVVKRFSSRFIKDWMFDLCLELLYDPVPNVRLQVSLVGRAVGDRGRGV